MTDLVFADVSEWQGDIDWAAYGAQNQAVIVRAAYGSGHVDTKWDQNIAGALAHCRAVGVYLYFVASQPLQPQIDVFVRLTQSLPPDARARIVAIVDLEEGDPATVMRLGDQWVAGVHAAIGGTEWEYSFLAFIRQAGRNGVDWLAAYQNGEPTEAHKLWQCTDKHQFAGIASPCDASVFHGSIDDLLALIGASQEDDMADPTTQALLQQLISETRQSKVLLAALALDRIYPDVLNRTPDVGGENYWIDKILNGETIEDVLREIAGSPEAQAHAKQ